MNKVQAVVSAANGAPVTLETILVPDPGPGEVLVKVQACGVCHTDLHYREGAIGDEFPYFLGHEAAGVVEKVGDDVDNVAPGDFVIIAWRAPCATCRSCERGRPWYCFDSRNAAQPMTLEDGTPLSPALGIGAFAELTLVAAGQAVKVDPRADAKAAGLIGCGIMAGLGAAINTGGVSRGDSVAVFGCGGVGDAAVAGSKLAGAHTIIAVDIDDRKLEWAKGFGATHTVNSREVDAVEAIQEITGGNGADVCIEAVGLPQTYEQAFFARDLGGDGRVSGCAESGDEDRAADDRGVWSWRVFEVVLVWGLPADAGFPDVHRPVYAGTTGSGWFVSESIGIGDVEEAFHKMERGEVLRSVVVM